VNALNLQRNMGLQRTSAGGSYASLIPKEICARLPVAAEIPITRMRDMLGQQSYDVRRARSMQPMPQASRQACRLYRCSLAAFPSRPAPTRD
jgi:hypothetical protein